MRTIHVDLRYMQWVMDAIAGADAVLEEMGGRPAID
ncbi:S46 family peptidase [Sorangium sp. So ce1389]